MSTQRRRRDNRFPKIGGGVLLSETEASQAAHLLEILLAECTSKRSISGSLVSVNPGDLQAIAQRSYVLRLARRSRFSNKLFGEPAWDMLLALYATGKHVALSSTEIIKFAAAAPSTGLRHLTLLDKEGLIVRTQHQTDGRLTLVSLSKRGRSLLEEYFLEAIEGGLAPS